MKQASPLVIIAILLLSLISCGHSAVESSLFSRELYLPEYASGFRILGAETGENVMIEVKNPWQGADSVVTRLLIDRDGSGAPDGFDGQVMKGDARRIVTLSSTHIAMLDAIGQVDKVVGVSGLDFISNPVMRSNPQSVGDVGYDGNINMELLMALRPDVVLLYGVSGASSMEGKLRELGIPYLYIGDYVEDSPLGKAEWLVVMAELTGVRAQGEATFAHIPSIYNALKQLVADSVTEAPSVMLNIPYGDAWFMPSADSYMARLIADAGARYVYEDTTGGVSRPIDLEQAYRLTSQSDMWLNVGTAVSLDQLRGSCPKFTDTRCFRNGDIYNNNRRSNSGGGNDFFESGAVHPDVVLHDLVSIFHPEILNDTIAMVYYQKLR